MQNIYGKIHINLVHFSGKLFECLQTGEICQCLLFTFSSSTVFRKEILKHAYGMKD